MPQQQRLRRETAALTSLLLTMCGGGSAVSPNDSITPQKLTVTASAGAPIQGAYVQLLAINDQTGELQTDRTDHGILATGGPTDKLGQAQLTPPATHYVGIAQVKVSGDGLSYPDPSGSDGAPGHDPATIVSLPSNFYLSSYIAKYDNATATSVPCTLWTTVADAAAKAWAQGRNARSTTHKPISEALPITDAFLERHLTSSDWHLRTAIPVALTAPPAQSLRDAVFAALPDVAFNRLARDISSAANVTPGNVITAITLATTLQTDVSDGLFDGKTAQGTALTLGGHPPYILSVETTRAELAKSLDAWATSTSNATGLASADLLNGGVFTAISGDTSPLYPVITPSDPDHDTTPPSLAFISAPPQATNQSTITFSVSAVDCAVATGCAGVRSVSAVVGAGPEITGTQSADGLWTFKAIELPAEGENTILVWAKDNVGNSGRDNQQAPYRLTAKTMLDVRPPTPVLDSSFSTYHNEQGMTIATKGGIAIVPAVYSTKGSRIALANGSQIFKSGSRLSATAGLDPSTLEGSNPDNIPTLRFLVPFSFRTDAAIADAAYTVHTKCDGCTYQAATGKLLQSAYTQPGYMYYDLPLSLETVPALASIPGVATLEVTLALTDAAGNVGALASPLTISFHVLGPPLAIAEDRAYASAADPKASTFYSPSSAGYAMLYDPNASPFLPERQVRLARYLVTNPSPLPVALNVQLRSANWTVIEEWKGDGQAVTGVWTLDNASFSGTYAWGFACDSVSNNFPCGDQNSSYMYHLPGAAARFQCESKSTNTWNRLPATIATAQGSAAPSALAYLPGTGPSTDLKAADQIASSYVVPAATSSAPGTLVLYVTRPIRADSRSTPLQFAKLNANAASSQRFETLVSDAWWDDGIEVRCSHMTQVTVSAQESEANCQACGKKWVTNYSMGCGSYACFDDNAFCYDTATFCNGAYVRSCWESAKPQACSVNRDTGSAYRTWYANRWIRYLASATEQLTGSLTATSLAINPSGSTLVGEPSDIVTGLDLSHSISH